MKISLDNYEAYMLDLLEGTISRDDRDELEAFLLQHPGLRPADPSGFLAHPEEKISLSQADKARLKKNSFGIPMADHLLIAKLENELNPEEEQLLHELERTHPEIVLQDALYKRTRIQAEEIAYPFKNELKKQAAVFTLTAFRAMAAAAAILLAVVLWFLWKQDNPPANERVSAEPAATHKAETLPAAEKAGLPEAGTERTGRNIHHRNKKGSPKEAPKQKRMQDEVESAPLLGVTGAPVNIKEESLSPVPVEEPFLAQAPPEEYLTWKEALLKMGNDGIRKMAGLGKKKESGKEPPLWAIARTGAETVSDLTGSHVDVKPEKNTEGETQGFSFIAGKFEFTRIRQK